MKHRVRLLSVIIFVAGLSVSLKLGGIWIGVESAMAADPPSAAGPPSESGKSAPDKAAPAAAQPEPVKPAPGGELAKGEVKNESTSTPPAKPARDQSGAGDGASLAEATDEELAVLQKLAVRRDELAAQAKALDLRDQVLAATEQRIDSKIAEMRKIEATIKTLLKSHDEQQNTQLQSLVKIYEAMKPKDAARIFEYLEMDILLGVVERMREAKSAPIISSMDPKKAQAVTEALAQRRDLPKMVN